MLEQSPVRKVLQVAFRLPKQSEENVVPKKLHPAAGDRLQKDELAPRPPVPERSQVSKSDPDVFCRQEWSGPLLVRSCSGEAHPGPVHHSAMQRVAA